MSGEEIAYLKNEIARLNKIITVLLKYNDLLNAENALLKNANGQSNAEMAVPETWKGTIESNSAFPEIQNGNNNADNAIPENENGNINSGSAIPENRNGQSNASDGIHKTGKGNPSFGQPLPAFIEPSPGVLSALHNLLQSHGFNQVKYSATRNAALLLLHFHNKNAGSYASLRKLTGLSNYGLAKFIRSLKKRNLIIRTGWQQFSITESGEALVRGAWEKTVMP